MAKIAKYICENHISVEQVSRDTGIAEAKLINRSEENLSATELLEVCVYLNIRPEQLMAEVAKKVRTGDKNC